MTASWFIYLIRCSDGSLYTGITTDVERRFTEHAAGKGAKYLRGRGPLLLVFRQQVGSRSQALCTEAAIKQLGKTEKEAIISRGSLPSSLLVAHPTPTKPATPLKSES